MLESFEVSTVLPATPKRLYQAWLNSKDHTNMTGSQASIEDHVGGKHYEWDGYIWGVNLELEPFSRIVQSWRSTEFPADSQDSRLEVRFEAIKGGTKLTLIHSDIPEGQGASYESGWDESYFQPMKQYFKPAKKAAAKTAKTKAAPRKAKAKPAKSNKSATAKKPARRKAR
jgi:activator of HSP90 ATPase